MQVGFVHSDWRDHPEVDAGMLAVLAVLATYADRAGFCWPSQKTIGEKCKRSRAWANLQIAKLEKIGLLEHFRRHHPKGGERACLYRLFGHDTLFARDKELTPPVSEPDTNTFISTTGLSPGGEAPEVATDQLKEVPEGWYPTDADLDKLFVGYPDLIGRIDQIGRSTRRFVEYSRRQGRKFADFGAAWYVWMLNERVPEPKVTPVRSKRDDLAARNAATANAALERIMNRRADRS